MNVFDLVAKLTLDTSEYDRDLDSAEREINAKSQGIKKGITALAAGGAAAMGAFAVASVKTGASFDSSMSQVAATMGYTVDELNDAGSEAAKTYQTLSQFAQRMGSTTAFSASQSADALNYMALAGYDAETSMRMLPNVLNLAAAGGIDLASASDMVTDAQSALNLSLDETSTLVDQMARASSKSNTSVSQLGEAILTIGATARGVAGGTTELSTVLGVLADNGIKGAEGGTHLRNMLLSLQTPTKDGTEALAKLGMTYDDMYDSAGNMRAIPEIMLQMQQSMEGMTQASKDAIISGIFNKTDLAAVNTLIGTSQERFDELTLAIGDSTGAAQAMADVQLDNLKGDVTLLKSAFEGLQITVSERLAPAFRTGIQFLTELIEHFDTLIPIIAGVTAAIGVFAIAINLTSLIKTVTTAVAGFNAVLAANPIGVVVALIAGLVVAITTLWKTNEEFRNRVTAAWNAITSAGQMLQDKIVGFFGNVGDTIKGIVSAAGNWGRDLIQNFIDGVMAKWYALRDTISSVAQTVKDFLGFSEPKKGPLSDFHTYAPDMMQLFAKGIKDNEKLVSDQINSSLSLPDTASGSFGGGSMNSYTGSPINITVYGAEGQDVHQLADILIDEITRRTEREQAAFA